MDELVDVLTGRLLYYDFLLVGFDWLVETDPPGATSPVWS